MTKELIVDKNPKSGVAEAIRIIRTNIEFSGVDKKVKIVLVTSSIPGEGKSFVSSNLAVAFAQNRKKVLLIDCDLRKGRLHKIFDMNNDKGLSNLLLDNFETEFKNYIRKTEIDNLYLLSKGAVPPNPSELLNSPKTKALITVLAEKFDIVILDGTPTNGLTDSLILTKYADKTVLVAAAGYTKTTDLDEAKKSLESVNASIAGIVVNKTQDVHSNYYQSYYE